MQNGKKRKEVHDGGQCLSLVRNDMTNASSMRVDASAKSFAAVLQYFYP